MNFRSICLMFLLFAAAQAVDPFEGDFPRLKCLKGITLEGCNVTLLEAYNKRGLPEWQKPDQNINNATTYFMLFTRRNRNNPEYLDQCGESLPKNTNFKPGKQVVIIIHGYVEGVCELAWQQEMKIQFLCRDDYNVILVDYSWGNQLDYYRSVQNARVVGKQCAFLISIIMNQTGITGQSFHIIGHSLGGQVAGLCGYYLFLLTGQKVRRITALDHAGPGFMNSSLEDKLDKGDACLVDVIHTNAGPCLPNFGYPYPSGHADFYPNGGSTQLSCISNIVPSFLKGDALYGITTLVPTLCFHKQSVQYFKVSINPCGCEFVGVECSNYSALTSGSCKSSQTNGHAIMGMNWEDYLLHNGSCGSANARQNESRVYFLNTTCVCPYCDKKTQGLLPNPPGLSVNSTLCFQ